MSSQRYDAERSNGPEPQQSEPRTQVEDPARLLRVLGMVHELREEVAHLRLDESSRRRLREVQEQTLSELKNIVSEDLHREIESFSIPLDGPPTEQELRITQAQLAGWLEGLFAGLQAAVWTQQMRDRAEQQGRPEIAERQRQPGQYL